MPRAPLVPLALLAAFTTGAALGYKWRDNTAGLERARGNNGTHRRWPLRSKSARA